MRCLSIGRVIRRGQEKIQAEDKVQNGRVPNLQVEIHRPHGETPRIKEASCTMKYQLAQIIKRSIEASVIGEEKLVVGMAKRVTKLKIAPIRIEHKELERQHQS